MRRTLLRWLACPGCGGAFTLAESDTAGEEVVTGALHCASCEARYPVRGGIPRLLPSVLIEEQQRTAAAFGWQWNHFARLHERDVYVEQLLDWIAPLTASDVRDRVVLDAGCGMGRLAAACATLGAREVVAVDISAAVEAAYANTRDLPNVHVVQADLTALPLRRDPGPFELIVSIGVLHHLPEPEAGFAALVRHLTVGGTIAVWLYGYENNEWLVRYVDGVRRRLTSRLPYRALAALSVALALPLEAVLRLVYAPADRWTALRALKRRLPYPYLLWLSRYGFHHTRHVVFDHLVAPKAEYLTRQTVEAWFAHAGLRDTTITPRNANSWRGYGRRPAPAQA
jgi:SAM-dependent methyltransferase